MTTIPQINFRQRESTQPDIEILDLSKLYLRTMKDHDPQAPHRVSFFMLILFEKGEGKQMVDFQEYPFSPGSVISVQREQVIAFDFSSKPEGKLLIFNQRFLDAVHANMKLPSFTPTHLGNHYSPILDLEDENLSRIHTLFHEIRTELECENGDPLLTMYLFSALSLLHQRLKPAAVVDTLSPAQSRLLAKFIALLQREFERIRDANWYADQLATTYKTLNLVCKAATSMTAKQMIDAFTIIEIKRRLVVSKVTSQQLAYEFGFEDPSNFVKYFKKEAGMTPSAFRKKYRNIA